MATRTAIAKAKDERASKLQTCLAKIHQAISDLKSRAFLIGEQLTLVRPLFDTSEEFDAWVDAEAGISRGASYNYRSLWAVWHRKNTDRFSLGALYLLARDSTPTDAEEEAIRLAKTGHKIDEERARQIISACTTEVESVAPELAPIPVQKLDGESPESGMKGVPFDAETAAPCDDSAPVDCDREPTHAGTRFLRRLDDLPELPGDLFEAVENFKLAIIRHRANHWSEVSPESVGDWCDWLKSFANQPA